MRDPCIFCRILPFLSEVEYQVETGEVRIAVNNGLNLLILNYVHLTNRFNESVNQSLL